MSGIEKTKALLAAVKDMLAASDDNTVGMVVRVDDKDTTLTSFFSEQGEVQHAKNPQDLDRQTVTRYCVNKTKTGTETVQLDRPNARGFHAEELLIRSWPALLAKAGGTAKKIELVLSKSPCHGDAGSSPMDVMSETQTLKYGTGCACKLAAFAQAHGGIQFNIFYTALAGSKMNPNDGKMKKRIENQQAWDSVVEKHGLGERKVPRSFHDAPPAEQAIKARKEREAFQKLEQQLIEQASGKHQSIGQALEGIAKLNSEPNVEVAPYPA